MSGLEVAGVILGILPLLIESYDRIVKPMKSYRKFSSKFKALYDGFVVQRTIFRAECILLLTPITLSRTLATSMLDDTQHPAWKDEWLQKRFSKQIGSLGSACNTTISRIGGLLRGMEEKIKDFEETAYLSVSQQSISVLDWRKAIGKKLKFSFRSEEALRASLEELTKLNDTFRTLSSLVIRFESQTTFDETSRAVTATTTETSTPTVSSKAAQRFDRFRTVRDASVHLYETLCKACNDHNHEHFVQLFLGVDETLPATDHHHIRFSLSYMVAPSDRIAPFVPTGHIQDQVRNSASPSAVSPSASIRPCNPVDQAKNFTSILLDVESVNQTLPISSIASISDRAGHGQAVGGLVSSILHLPDVVPEPRTVLGKEAKLCSELLANLASYSSPTAEAGQNLTSSLMLWGLGAFQHFLRPSGPHQTSVDEAMSLSRRLSQKTRQGRQIIMPEYQRLGMAKVLSGAVLQFEGTPWLDEPLFSDEVYFLELPQTPLHKAPQKTRSGQLQNSTSGATSLAPPFINAHLKLDELKTVNDGVIQSETSTYNVSRFRHVTTIAPNRFLYHLGILLLELAYHTSFETLVREIREDGTTSQLPLSSDDSTAEFQIALLLADKVGATMGSTYARIVKQCVRCDFGCGEVLGDLALRKRVFEDVFCRLEALETGVGNLHTSSAPAIS